MGGSPQIASSTASRHSLPPANGCLCGVARGLRGTPPPAAAAPEPPGKLQFPPPSVRGQGVGECQPPNPPLTHRACRGGSCSKARTVGAAPNQPWRLLGLRAPTVSWGRACMLRRWVPWANAGVYRTRGSEEASESPTWNKGSRTQSSGESKAHLGLKMSLGEQQPLGRAPPICQVPPEGSLCICPGDPTTSQACAPASPSLPAVALPSLGSPSYGVPLPSSPCSLALTGHVVQPPRCELPAL